MKNNIENIREILAESQAALITSQSNRFYLTGFESSAGAVLITKQSAVFLIDFRYYEKAKKEVCDFQTVLANSLYEQINSIISKENIGEILIESDYVCLDTLNVLKRELKAVISEDDALSRRLIYLRSIKSEGEIKKIKKAQALTDKTFRYILDKIRPGVSERDIALEMEFYMRKLGSEGVAFDFIVVSGKNSSLPHGVPTDKKVENGDFITMDFGAVVEGYRSDMTRTVAVGSVSEEQRRVYNTVLQAQQKAIESIAAGKVCRDIDDIARSYIYEMGYEGCFGHGLGHSVGVDIHETPCFNMRDKTVLQPGMVMTVEPGIYLENKFGVRIEDMVIIKENGIENITKSPKELIII